MLTTVMFSFSCLILGTSASCRMVLVDNMLLPDGSWDLVNGISDKASCDQRCLDDSACQAYIFLGNACRTAPSFDNQEPDEDGGNFYKKQCDETTTSTTTTPETTTSTTTTPEITTSTTTTTEASTSTITTPSTTSAATPPSTTLATQATTSTASSSHFTVLQATDGQGVSIELNSSTGDTCKTACSFVQECQQYVYETANSRCKLFTTDPAKTSVPYSLLGTKTSCLSGKPCCYQTVADTGSLMTPAITLTQTLESCQDLCLKLSNCHAVVFTGSSCKVYTQLTNTIQRSGYTLLLSTNATSNDDIHVSNVCLRGSCLNPMFCLISIAVASAILLTRSGFHL